MSGPSSPDPRYYKDAHGLRPRWRLFFSAPRQYLWMVSPRWIKQIKFWNDERRWRRAQALKSKP